MENKAKQEYFFCQTYYIVILDTRGSSLVLCKKVIKDQSQGYICFKCSDMTTFNNLGYIQSLEDMKQDYCEHAKLCTVLFDEEMVEDDISPESNEVKILQRSPEFVTLIYPAKALDKLPGIVVLNSRSTKPKCHTATLVKVKNACM